MLSNKTYAVGRGNVRARLNRWANLVALATAPVVFLTGLVLFTCFHIGAGSRRIETLGFGRLAWINLHRLAALPLLAALAAHLWLHWRLLRRRAVDLLLYGGFAVLSTASLVAWFAVSGSSPLGGPLQLTHANHMRHHWIDVHNLSALATLAPAWQHIRCHWSWFERTLRQFRSKFNGSR